MRNREPFCESCGDRMSIAQDPDDAGPDVWCRHVRYCEHPKCDEHGCGDNLPSTCDLCEIHFCQKHLHRLADGDFCAGCKAELETILK